MPVLIQIFGLLVLVLVIVIWKYYNDRNKLRCKNLKYLAKCKISTQKCYDFYSLDNKCKQYKRKLYDRTCCCYILDIVSNSNMRDDKKFMSEAVSKAGSALELASIDIKENNRIIHIAINNDWTSLKYIYYYKHGNDFFHIAFKIAIKKAQESLNRCKISTQKCNSILHFGKDKMIKVCEQEKIDVCDRTCSCEIHKIVSSLLKIKNNLIWRCNYEREFMNNAVSKAGAVLRETSYYDSIREDKEIVLNAVANDGMSLEFACDWFKSDKEVILTAFKNNYRSLQFVPNLYDYDFYIYIMKINADAYYYLPDYKNDYEIMSIFIESKGINLKLLGLKIKCDKIILSKIVLYLYNRLKIEDAPEQLRSDRDIVIAAVKQDGFALKFASDELKDNIEIIIIAANAVNISKQDLLDDLFKYDKLLNIAYNKQSIRTLIILSLSSFRNILHKLNSHGSHYANVFKRNISEFLIPTGQHWEINCGLCFRKNYDEYYWTLLYKVLNKRK